MRASTKHADPIERVYIAAGLAAMQPGMRRFLEIMQREFEAFMSDLREAQHEHERAASPKRARSQKPRASSGWPADPEERSREMRRRRKLWGKKKTPKPVKLHPRDAAHPDHQKWITKMRRASKASWANLTEAERAARVAKLHKRHSTRLAVAS